MIELLAAIEVNVQTAIERAKGLQHQLDEMKVNRDHYQRLYILEQKANEELREELKPKVDLTKVKSSALISELARRVDLIEGEL